MAIPLIVVTGATAQEVMLRRQPIVVLERPGAISTAPFLQDFATRVSGLERQGRTRSNTKSHRDTAVANRAYHPIPLAMEARLPMVPTTLRVANPTTLSVEGLPTPLFVMGMDADSLAWFARSAHGLATLGAQGLVVQADDRERWQTLRRRAADHGIALQLMIDAVLVEGYGITTYPVVMASPQTLARGARHE